LNTTGIVGLGEAARIAFEEMEETEEKIKNIRNKLWERIQNEIPKVYLNGPDGETRIANNLSFNIIGIRNEPLLVALNEKGIIAGGGSACSAEEKNPSHVLESIGVRKDDIFSVIRITLGKYNKETEIDTIVYNFKEVIKQLREMSPFWTE
jgi:cysteine desulfurase